jgi:hypothetical protein
VAAYLGPVDRNVKNFNQKLQGDCNCKSNLQIQINDKERSVTVCSVSMTHFVLTRRVPQVEQELPTIPEHLSSAPVFSGFHVTRSLVICVCFLDRCLSFCTFPFGHYVVCSSSIYRFWLPLWYLQTLLVSYMCNIIIW